ncbi:hypothetical protein CIPAW_04G086900 [Carya illinoinensis]|uniref:Pectinesterase inhibitor domain-containing protein n=1 Tax=Carya illinoinensis TaxID=32201 RepID=A0A8T1QTQ9_CARIL|nr:hypothetical protein CIPAW_04G086900 [Carya illinoinensis]
MGSSAIFLLLVISLLSLAFPPYVFHQPYIFVTGDASQIQKTCKSTKYYELCLSSLKSDPTSLNADTKGLAVIMVGIGMANATATSSFLSPQLLSTTNDTILKKDLIDESYDYAYMHASAAADYPNACRNVFKRYPGSAYPSELARREEALKQLCYVVLGIIDLLDS